MKHKQDYGFSLIEVLVALVIISISIGAFLQTSQTNINNHFIIKNKILAQNEAWNAIVNLEKNTAGNYKTTKKEQKTSIDKIKKIIITANKDDKNISSLTKFIYVSKD